MRVPSIILLILTVLFVVACGEDSEPAGAESNDGSNKVAQNGADSGDASAPAALDTSFDDLQPGTHDLTISGAISSDGAYTGEAVVISYEPFRSPNFAGQHEIEIFADIAPTDFTEETVVQVYVRFPADIAPGTYSIQSPDRDTPDAVQAFVSFDNIAVADFDEAVTGTLEVVEVGGQLTAAFNFSAASARDEAQTVDVQGRVNQVLFSYRPEATLALSGLVDAQYSPQTSYEDDQQTVITQYLLDDFSNEFNWMANYRQNEFLYSVEVSFFLAGNIAPGTYDVAYAPSGNQRVPEGLQVGARISYQNTDSGIDFSADTITGTLTIAVDDRNYASATFELVGTDSESGETLNVTGSFDYFESQFGG